jgi:hypothetical protein
MGSSLVAMTRRADGGWRRLDLAAIYGVLGELGVTRGGGHGIDGR